MLEIEIKIKLYTFGYKISVVLCFLVSKLSLRDLSLRRNELAVFEFIYLLVATLNRGFGIVERPLMEKVMDGCMAEPSKSNILTPNKTDGENILKSLQVLQVQGFVRDS